MKTTIKLLKPDQRWLFGGLGFHNSEATMSGIMSEDFKNQVVLKCFRGLLKSSFFMPLNWLKYSCCHIEMKKRIIMLS
jgi:hypothetical protein